MLEDYKMPDLVTSLKERGSQTLQSIATPMPILLTNSVTRRAQLWQNNKSLKEMKVSEERLMLTNKTSATSVVQFNLIR